MAWLTITLEGSSAVEKLVHMLCLDRQLWQLRISLSAKLRLYNTCILPIFLSGSQCWMMHAISMLWCQSVVSECFLVHTYWCLFISNDEVQCLTDLTYRNYPDTGFIFGHMRGWHHKCLTDFDFLAFCELDKLDKTTEMTRNALDEDGAEWPQLPQAVMDWISQPSQQLTTLKAVGNYWGQLQTFT